MASAGGSSRDDPIAGLIARTEDLGQERRWLGILHGLVLCSGILPAPDLFLGIVHRPYLCPRIMDWSDVSVLLHGPVRWFGIICNLCRGTFNGLYGPDLC